MIFTDIKMFAALKTGLVNSAGAYVDGIVDETTLGKFVNLRFKELFMEFAEKYPEYYESILSINTIANTETYALGATPLAMLEIKWAGIKYASTDTQFMRLKRTEYNILFPNSTDASGYSQSSPFYYLTDDRKIGIIPVPTAAVVGGLRVRALDIPADMTANDTPEPIPSTAHHLIGMFTVADVWEAKGDWVKSDKAYNRANYEKERFFKNYQPRASDEPVSTILEETFNPYRHGR